MPMPTESHKRSLTILNVGHGNAAVLIDEGGTVVFDTGRNGTNVIRFLRRHGIDEIEALYLSHSDADHIGGASTLLLDGSIRVGRVYVNADSTKRSDVHRQLRYAVVHARKTHGTVTHTELSTTLNTSSSRSGARIEVLYPTPEVLLSGAGGVELSGESITSNSVSAVIRVGNTSLSSVLLCGDAEVSCVEHWISEGIDTKSGALVFPHHGGNPGTSDAEKIAQFCKTLTSLVEPHYVVFSIHSTLHSLPRQEIIDALVSDRPDVVFVCTQLPSRFHSSVATTPCWRHHLGTNGAPIIAADISCTLHDDVLGVELVLHLA
jgi:competence protein ComEC